MHTTAFRVCVDADGIFEALELLDQRHLPHRVAWIRCTTPADAADAIRSMVVRGAPAIAITAAYGMALAEGAGCPRATARALLADSRPTAVNLTWALERLDGVADSDLFAQACAIHDEDLRINRALGDHGVSVIEAGAQVYTHCNTGALATGGWGTALGVIRSAHREFRGDLHVWVGETRPYLQGARLTAWELANDDIDCTLVTDSAAASLMAAGKIDAVLVGADRVASNGDTANKIGTLSLAILAHHHRVPFYVCMPMSTLDRACPGGEAIPIEVRDAREVRGHGGVSWAADVPVYNPAFDVTPARLVTAWITEDGVVARWPVGG